MNKKQIIKTINQNHGGKKVYFKEYDASFTHKGDEFFIKVLPASTQSIITVNSSIVWEIKKGSFKGPRFKTSSKQLYDIRDFMKLKNKIIVFYAKPYKIFKALNESDLADISDDNFVHNVHYFSDPNDIKNILK